MKLAGAAGCVVVAASLVGLASAVAAPPSPAPASPGPPPTESQLADAKQRYAAASRLYDLAEYESALTEFKEAYRAVGDPAFLFNIAQCHRKLGHRDEELTFFKSYLRRSPHAKNRIEVERRIQELERAMAATPPPPSPEPKPPAPPPPGPTLTPPPPPERQPEATLVSPAAPGADEGRGAPLYKRGWFWVAVGVVLAGGAATAYLLATRSSATAPFCPDCTATAPVNPP